MEIHLFKICLPLYIQILLNAFDLKKKKKEPDGSMTPYYFSELEGPWRTETQTEVKEKQSIWRMRGSRPTSVVATINRQEEDMGGKSPCT